MSDIIEPTQEELLDACGVKEKNADGGIFQVHREDDTSWRHGSYRTTTFKRQSDDTYWQAVYRVSTDGEVNELREGIATVRRVYPHTVTTVVYNTDPQETTP